MSEASASGSAGSGGAVLFSSDTCAAFVARAMSRASRYRPCNFVRLVSFRGDHHGLVPELLPAVMVAKPVCNHVSLTDVATGLTDGGRVVSKQQVDAGALLLGSVEQGTKVRATGVQHVPGPVRDLRRGQPAGRAVDQEQLDLLASHQPDCFASSRSISYMRTR